MSSCIPKSLKYYKTHKSIFMDIEGFDADKSTHVNTLCGTIERYCNNEHTIISNLHIDKERLQHIKTIASLQIYLSESKENEYSMYFDSNGIPTKKYMAKKMDIAKRETIGVPKGGIIDNIKKSKSFIMAGLVIFLLTIFVFILYLFASSSLLLSTSYYFLGFGSILVAFVIFATQRKVFMYFYEESKISPEENAKNKKFYNMENIILRAAEKQLS